MAERLENAQGTTLDSQLYPRRPERALLACTAHMKEWIVLKPSNSIHLRWWADAYVPVGDNPQFGDNLP